MFEVKSCGESLMSSTEFLKCLKVVLEANLQREGYLLMPVGPDTSVETVTDLQRALELTRHYLIPDTNSDAFVNPSI